MNGISDKSACIFCSLRETLHPDGFLHTDDLVFAINDIAPVAPAHALIIPKDHNAQIGHPASETIITRLTLVASHLAKDLGIDTTGYRLVINQGADSGQQVAHLHMHLIGGTALGLSLIHI